MAMAVPVVNRKLLEELEAMGFSPEQATRALHFSGNSSTEAAIDWIVDHQNDPDLDQMPRVSIDIDIEAPEPTFVTEEMIMGAQELRDRAEEKKKEKKNSQRETEKERIRAGKELLEAKTIAEENERKRYVAVKKAEKEEARRAKERILRKLQNDMVERRRKLGLPPETPAAVKPSLPFEDNRRTSGVSYVTKADQMRECLRSLKRNHKDEDARVKRAFQTLLIYVGNVVKNPDNEKFRRIRLSNPVFQSRVGSLEGGVEFLELCGFEKIEGARFLFLLRDKVDLAVLNLAGTQLKSALTNPFFGLLEK
ncbi:UBX domain-containing protein 1-like [Rhodamnia argentea]|uniref:UBX domain-containing protein 1-like n=1 Tax=Rhodamnia argentea TaxID=178133 RepID=A0ABM3HP13_9MYRT|nr:UBX domain-containing protein 1-like [Rhodamnia argentea]